MFKRMYKSLKGLSRQGPATGICYGTGDHARDRDLFFCQALFNTRQCGFRIQSVKYGFHHKQINPSVHKSGHLFLIGLLHFIKGNSTVPWIIYIG